MDSNVIIALVAVAALAIVLLLALRKKPQLPREPGAKPEQLRAPAEQPSADVATTQAEKRAEKRAPRDASDTLPLEVEPEQQVVPAPPRPSLVPRGPSADDLASLKKGLASTRGGFIARLSQLFRGKKQIDPALLDQIEEVLIGADIGAPTTQRILDRLRERMSKSELTDGDRVWSALREEASAILNNGRVGLSLQHQPSVILVVGVNGVGKTTTTGKLASRLSSQGSKVILAAADTFRAAAVLQLEVWGKRIGCPVVRGKEHADPSAVVFDAIKRAQSDQADILLIDTAGRLHTKAPLMEELKKIGRTVEKALGRPADEILLVLDATNGQNALQQAAMFRDVLPVTGIVLTKLDGTAKGGVVLGIVDAHKLPIHYVGIGERVEDLREFDPSSFVEALFERTETEPSAA
jgi:fused signal recognition particle receptor